MYKKQIVDYIDSQRDNLATLTKRLVKINSVKGNPKEGMPFGEGPGTALNTALEIGKEQGFLTRNYDGYVGAIDLSEKEAGLDILAHLDVVPANPKDWTVCQPFEPTEVEGKIYGRGASDDKGPAMAALIAMKAVKELGIPLSKNVRLLVGTDEECGGQDIDYYYNIEKPAPATFSPDADFPVINVEKGRLSGQIVASYPESTLLPRIISASAGDTTNVIPDTATITLQGIDLNEIKTTVDEWSTHTGQSLTFETLGDNVIFSIHGVGGHAAHPHPANNAVTGALALLSMLPLAKSEGFEKLQQLSQMFPHGDWDGNGAGIKMSDEVSEALTISLNILNISEAEFTATFDSRTPICSNKENTQDIIAAKCKTAGLELRVMSTALPHHVPSDSTFIKTLLSAYEEYTGLKGECLVSGGGTYVHGLENAVAFGPAFPGTENNIHGADEFVVLDHLVMAAKIFAQVIVDLCS